jgi:hypothetical protein
MSNDSVVEQIAAIVAFHIGHGMREKCEPLAREIVAIVCEPASKESTLESIAAQLVSNFPLVAIVRAFDKAAPGVGTALNAKPAEGDAERLEDERWRLMNSFGNGPYRDGQLQSRIDEIDGQLKALTTKTPVAVPDIDGQRWRALIGCARIRVLGSAGIVTDNPEGYAHIGLELWTHHEANHEGPAVEWLTKFADKCIAATPAASEGEGS